METKVCAKCGVKPVSAFSMRSDGYGYRAHCRSCVSDYKKKWLKAMPAADKAVMLRNNANYRARTRYGLTEKEYRRRLTRPCRICGVFISGKGGHGMHLDHCHKTGKIRGTLCHSCNKGLGVFKDDIKLLTKAVQYLKRYA